MDRTFDDIAASIRAGYEKPSGVAEFVGSLLGKFTAGVAIGLGIAVGMAIARASVGL